MVESRPWKINYIEMAPSAMEYHQIKKHAEVCWIKKGLLRDALIRVARDESFQVKQEKQK